MADVLGIFEQAVLLAIRRLSGDAYGRLILRDVSDALGREAAAGAVYATLDRLEAKGLATSTLKPGTAERGGRPRRYYLLTAQGDQALEQTRSTLDRLWSAVPLPQAGPC